MNGKTKKLEWTWKHVAGALVMMLLAILVAPGMARFDPDRAEG